MYALSLAFPGEAILAHRLRQRRRDFRTSRDRGANASLPQYDDHAREASGNRRVLVVFGTLHFQFHIVVSVRGVGRLN